VPNLRGNELKYASEAVNSEWVSTGGSFIPEFESRFAEYLGVGEAVACQSGTSGLHLGLLAAGVTHEDAVIVPCLTFAATVNPLHYIGAEPVFMDCDDTLCIDPVKLREYCANACVAQNGRICNRKGKPVKAVIVVHIFGEMANMEAIMDIAEAYDLVVIEDACEAVGSYCLEGRYKGRHAGTIGHIGVYSFNGNKIVTTGGGGLLTSSNSGWAQRARHLSTQSKVDPVFFLHDEVGFNYRMTNLQAALGLAQLEQLEGFVEIKRRNYDCYRRLIEDVGGLSLLPFKDGIRSNRWFYSLVIGDGYRFSRNQLIRRLAGANIQARPIWELMHRLPYNAGCEAYKIERAEHFLRHIVNLPCSTNLTSDDIERVVSNLR
jgi:aminotransferase in exopolysaccharide biosynthesis